MNILKALFGNYSKKELKRIQPICDKVLALEDKYAAMSESELKNQTAVLKEHQQMAKYVMDGRAVQVNAIGDEWVEIKSQGLIGYITRADFDDFFLRSA